MTSVKVISEATVNPQERHGTFESSVQDAKDLTTYNEAQNHQG